MSTIGSGLSAQTATLIAANEPIMGSVSSACNNAIPVPTPLNKADCINSTVSTGGIPAVKPNLMNRIGTSTANAARGAVNSTVTATREVGNVIAKEVLPTPEPLSVKLMRNKFLGAVLVGGFVNGITTAVKVAKGEVAQDQAVHAVVRDTSMGAITGLSFASGMGLTASTLGRVIGGVPLSIAALTIGTLASIGVSELVKDNISFFNK